MPFRRISWRRAEKIAGERVDRRRTFGYDGKELVMLARWTQSCSGCCEGGEYGGLLSNYEYDDKAQCHVGFGCRECGYSGKVRQSMWVPAETLSQARAWA